MKLESTEPVEILEIFGKRAQVIKPGLERMREAWKVLGFPSKKIPTVLIAGTNGKGTTSGFLYRLLAVTGLRVGLFTSPHVREFRERIAVSDCEVTNQRLVASIHRMKQVLDAFWDKLTFFEINTLLALLTFEEEKVDWIVLEVGLGGRLDATNVVEPALSIITSIGMDHAEYLGPDTTAIAKEKAGIMRAGKPCIWGGLTVSDQAADAVVRSEAERLNSPLKTAGIDFAEGSSQTLFVGDKSWPWPKQAAFWPSYLRHNFATSVAAYTQISESSDQLSQDVGSVLRGLEGGRGPWPASLWGRFQRVYVKNGDQRYELLIDVCHNPHGATAFAKGLEELGIATGSKPKPALISILADKDARGIWSALQGRISDVIKFRIPSERSWSNAATEALPGDLLEDFAAAFLEAQRRPLWRSQQPWLICGSVAAVGEVLKHFEQTGWQLEL